MKSYILIFFYPNLNLSTYLKNQWLFNKVPWNLSSSQFPIINLEIFLQKIV